MNHLVTTDADSVCLYRFNGAFRLLPSAKVTDHLDHAAMGVIVDTETTGTGPMDVVIEIAVLPFFFDTRDGQLLEVCDPYVGQQDPGRPLSAEITEITGLTDGDVSGKRIDWKLVIQRLSNATFVAAYNAQFDRPLVHRAIAAAGLRPPMVPWACAMTDVAWRKLPAKPPSLALGRVCAWHGFFFDAHRALSDCKATLHLLDVAGQVRTLWLQSQQSSWIVAVAFPFNQATVETIKSRGGYKWDGDMKRWWTSVADDNSAQIEKAWMGTYIYGRGPNMTQLLEVQAKERFL